MTRKAEPRVEAVLARARTYPYDFPRESATYDNGEVRPFDSREIKNRTPVLAFGSNQSPTRLGQKYGHLNDCVIPIERAVLHDFDVVFSAHLTSYGSVPAMLQSSPGAQIEVALTWLDDEQLAIMHETEIREANYYYGAIDGVALSTETGAKHATVHAYFGTRGHLEHDDGGPIALSALACEGRRYPSMTTGDAIELVRRRHAPESDPDAFILTIIEDRNARRRISAALGERAVPFKGRVRRLD